MNKIRFSHPYKKLLDITGRPVRRAKLLLVTTIMQEDLRKAEHFYAYDTDNGTYQITFSSIYVLLLFQKPSGDLFTTVRPMYNRYGNKKEYYEGKLGEDFEVLIEP